ncbi:CYTH domain-containing protein [Roseivirga pacifica]|uniref:CYTH domain-containing protein n=1 Tax=Roseivirga pacifica TaxID=1267423 RepID=UPI003BAD52A9
MIEEVAHNMEIERKFLLNKLPPFKPTKEVQIDQGYIHRDENMEIRLRRIDRDFFQTIKLAGDLSREEFEIKISNEDFKKLWPLTEGSRLSKTRMFYKLNELVAEVDIYKGSLYGLITMEVEFDSETASERFIIPKWVEREVTYDSKYKNKNLSHVLSLKELNDQFG